MRRGVKRSLRIAALALAGVALFVAVTAVALERGGVAIVETRQADGGVRSTHVWYAVDGDELWLEAGTPENGWYVDVQSAPELTLRRDGGAARYRARPVLEPGRHEFIRAQMRAQYGWRDRWVSAFFDTTRSVAVRLEPLP